VVALHHFHQTPRANTRVDQVNLVHQPHQLTVLLALAHGPVIEARTRHFQQFALGAHAQLRMIFFNQLGALLFHRPSCFLP
jgi:hypothetical protein